MKYDWGLDELISGRIGSSEWVWHDRANRYDTAVLSVLLVLNLDILLYSTSELHYCPVRDLTATDRLPFAR